MLYVVSIAQKERAKDGADTGKEKKSEGKRGELNKAQSQREPNNPATRIELRSVLSNFC